MYEVIKSMLELQRDELLLASPEMYICVHKHQNLKVVYCCKET